MFSRLSLFLVKKFINLLVHWVNIFDSWVTRQETKQSNVAPSIKENHSHVWPKDPFSPSPPKHWVEKTRHLRNSWISSDNNATGDNVLEHPMLDRTGRRTVSKIPATETKWLGNIASGKQFISRSLTPLYPSKAINTLKKIFEPIRGYTINSFFPETHAKPDSSPVNRVNHSDQEISKKTKRATKQPAIKQYTPNDAATFKRERNFFKNKPVITNVDEQIFNDNNQNKRSPVSAGAPHFQEHSTNGGSSINPTANFAIPKSSIKTSHNAARKVVTSVELIDNEILQSGNILSTHNRKLNARKKKDVKRSLQKFEQKLNVSESKPESGISARTDYWPPLPPKTAHSGRLLQAKEILLEQQRLKELESEQGSPPWIV